MNSSEVKKQVRQFRRRFQVRQCTAQALEDIFKEQGFTLIEFNPVLNDEDVATVIHAFELEEMVARSRGFLFMDNNHRLVFLKEGLTEEEKCLVLAHEEGHYYLGHASGSAFIGRNVTQEFEANEFAHFLLQGSFKERIRDSAARHKKAIIAGVAAVAVGCGGVTASHEYEKYRERQIYEGDNYVTMHGEKYHLKTCVTIEGHETRRLTKEDVEAGTYEPCSVCQPDRGQ